MDDLDHDPPEVLQKKNEKKDVRLHQCWAHLLLIDGTSPVVAATRRFRVLATRRDITFFLKQRFRGTIPAMFLYSTYLDSVGIVHRVTGLLYLI